MKRMSIAQFTSHVTALGFEIRDVVDIVAEVVNYGAVVIGDDTYTYSDLEITHTPDGMLMAFEQMLDNRDSLPNNVLPLTPFFVKL